MTAADFFRWIEPLKKKISTLVSRELLTTINNIDAKTQLVQTKGLFTEKNNGGNSDIQRIQPYGFETYPYVYNSSGETYEKVSEAINLNIAGLKERAINIIIQNKELRPKDLVSGEVCLYSKDSDDGSTNRITIRPTDEIEIITKDDQSILINVDGIVITDDVNKNVVTMNSTGIKIQKGDVSIDIITMDANGIVIEDLNGNVITMSAASLKLENAAGKDVTIGAASVTINGNHLEVT